MINEKSRDLRWRRGARLVVAAFCVVILTACASPATEESLLTAMSNGAAPPQGFKVRATANDIGLNWDPVEGARGLEIQHSIDGGDWALLTDAMIDLDTETRFGGYSYERSGASPVTKFRIRTIFDSDTVSDWSETVTLGALGDSPAPPASGCADAMRAAALDQAGTAEDAYRETVENCASVSEWKAAAKRYPDALSTDLNGNIDYEGWLSTICSSYPTATVCSQR